MAELIYKTRQKRGYLTRDLAIVDTSRTSPLYFNIVEMPTVLTAGKNLIKVGLNGPFLKRNSDIDLEVLDFQGNPLYVEYTGFVDRLNYHYYIVYVYDITSQGGGTITLVGIANTDQLGQPITNPATQHRTEYNIRWSTSVDIKPLERNLTDIYFAEGPDVTVSQVLTPYKFNLGTYSINKTLFTQSLEGLRIISTTNRGVDFSSNSSVNIQDLESLNNTYNYFQKSSTANTVQTNVRKKNAEIEGGFIYSEYSRYSTILYDSQSRLSKDMEGSTFSIDNQDSGVSIVEDWVYYPFTSSNTIEIQGGSGSLPDQLAQYTPKIVTVLNNQYAILDKAPSVKVVDSGGRSQPVIRDLTFSKILNVTGAFAYPTSSTNEVESFNLSSSYLQFTFTDFKPITGDVYRIKTYVKEAGQSTEYYQLNDHIVTPPEYLVDSDKPNQAVYAKNKSDFFTYGELTDSTIPANYWRGFMVDQYGLIEQFSFSSTSSVSHYPLANALQVLSSGSLRRGFTSRYYQTYIQGEPYSLSFYCALEPGIELEVYMSSTPIKESLSGFTAPKAFSSTRNYHPEITASYSKFGKLVGTVSNMSGSATRFYDNVVFDFYPDSDGFGRPVFYLKNDTNISGSAYVSSISLTPLDLAGYTPSILQFSAAPPDSLWILYDDDASLSQSIDVKIEYYTADGKQSEYVTYIPNLLLNMVNEVPGFCAGGTSKFNDQCPFYYEIGEDVSNDLTRPTAVGTASLDPTLFDPNTYFWPTFSVNSYAGYSWNLKSFTVAPGAYSNANLVYSVANTQITTSWIRHDPLLPLYTSTVPGNNPFPTMYTVIDGGAPNTPATYSSTWIDEHDTLPEPERRPFYLAHGAALDRYATAKSHSLLLFESNTADIQADPVKKENLQKYLRSSRLYFPATTSLYPYDFYENGAIYNVRFNIARVPDFSAFGHGYTYSDVGTVINNPGGSEVSTWTQQVVDLEKYQPDEAGSKLMVYIADVASPIGNDILVPGREGFFPPTNNIATITNGAPGGIPPAIKFIDSGSGYLIDTYDLILVQYGEKAQLVFDACGLEFELDTDPLALPGSYRIYMKDSTGFWGGVISNIEWCKIGITTDSRYIKPVNFNNAFNTYIPFNPPPPIPPKNPFRTGSLFYNPSWPVQQEETQ